MWLVLYTRTYKNPNFFIRKKSASGKNETFRLDITFETENNFYITETCQKIRKMSLHEAAVATAGEKLVNKHKPAHAGMTFSHTMR